MTSWRSPVLVVSLFSRPSQAWSFGCLLRLSKFLNIACFDTSLGAWQQRAGGILATSDIIQYQH